MTVLGTWESGSAEWLAARDGRIGGSDVGAICGWSPFATREDLLARKAGLADPPKESAAMMRGTLLEPAILTWLCRRHGLTLDPVPSAATHFHPDDQRLIYNPDGITTCGTLLEAKTTGDRSEDHGWGRAGTDNVPLHYKAQVQWGMGIIGLTTCHLGVLAGGINGRPSLAFATYTIHWDPDLFATIHTRVAAFLDDLTILKGDPA